MTCVVAFILDGEILPQDALRQCVVLRNETTLAHPAHDGEPFDVGKDLVEIRLHSIFAEKFAELHGDGSVVLCHQRIKDIALSRVLLLRLALLRLPCIDVGRADTLQERPADRLIPQGGVLLLVKHPVQP